MKIKCIYCDRVFYYANPISSKGGKASKRKLTPEDARAMVKAREAKKAKAKGGDINETK